MTDSNSDLRALAEAATGGECLCALPMCLTCRALDDFRRAANPARILELLDRAETAERREATIASAYNIASQAIEDGEAALARLQEENRARLDELDEALHGLREPLTLADARRVRDTLTQNAHLRQVALAAARSPNQEPPK